MSGGILRLPIKVSTLAAAGFLALSPALAQDGAAIDLGPLRFLRPTVGPETEPVATSPAPAQAELSAPDVLPPEAALEAAPAVPAEATVPSPGAAPAAEAEPAVEQVQPLRLAVLAGWDAAATLNALQPLADGLRQALGRPAEILPMSSYGAMIDAQRLGRIDGGFYSAAAYVLAQAGCQCLEPLVAPAAADGTTAYYSIIVTPSNSGDDELADLNGAIVAAAGLDSIGGRRMPLAALLADGVDVETFFDEVRDVGSAEQAVLRMLAGEADAAFAWTSLSGDIAAGYSRGTLADLVARGEIAMSEVALVWRSPPIAHGPVAVGPAFSEAAKTALEAYLLALEEGSPEVYDVLNPFYSGGYVAVDAQDYGGLAVLAEQDVDGIRVAKSVESPAPSVPRQP